MTGAILLVAAAMLALIGCASLALGLPRHWRSVTGEPPSDRCEAIARRAGWVALSAAWLACIMRDGIGFAALTAPLLFAMAAFTVAMALSYRPAMLRGVAKACRRLASRPSGRPDASEDADGTTRGGQ